MEGTHKRGMEKNEQTSSEREMTGRGASRCAFPLSFSRVLSLSLFRRSSLFFKLSLGFALRCTTPTAAAGSLFPERFPQRQSREGTSSSSPFCISVLLTLSVFLRLSLPCHEHETYFESAHVYNKGLLRSMRQFRACTSASRHSDARTTRAYAVHLFLFLIM